MPKDPYRPWDTGRLRVMERAPEIVLPTSFAPLARPPATPRRPPPWPGRPAILPATLMNLLDSTVSNVAAPSIRADLGGSLATLQWIPHRHTLVVGARAVY